MRFGAFGGEALRSKGSHFFLDYIGAIAESEGQPSKFCNECVLQMFATLNWKNMTFLR